MILRLYSVWLCFSLFSSALYGQTFASESVANCNIGMTIFDNSCTASHRYFFEVTNAGGINFGSDVILEEVRLIVEHTWDSDLDIHLRSPGGKTVELSTDNGGGADHYGNPFDPTCSDYTSFNRQACLSITEGTPPFSGAYRPEGDFDDFNDGSNPNGFWMIELCDDAANDQGRLHFVELVFSTVTCTVPLNVTADDYSAFDVQLSWDTGDCAETLIEYGPPGFIPGTGAFAGGGTLVTISCPTTQPYTLSGLDQLTAYDIYLRSRCDGGGYTPNSCPVSIETLCNTPAATLLDDFDALSTCPTTCGAFCPLIGTWMNSSSDDFDWLVDQGGTASSSTGPDDDISGGGNYLYIESSGSACQDGSQCILESQCLLIGADNGDCHFSFNYHMYGIHINRLELQITVDGGLTWDNLWTTQGNQGNQWYTAWIDLSAYNGQLTRMRFVGTTGDSFRGDIALDQLTFYGSILSGQQNVFYADTDSDGFGDPMNTITVCTDMPPAGYRTNALDCDDSNIFINPDAIEIPCNGIDENCDPTDDLILPLPQVLSVTICSGSTATLNGDGNQYGTLYWFAGPNDTQVLAAGNTFNTPSLSNTTTYYVLDSLDSGCTAPQRTAVTVNVESLPDLSVSGNWSICAGSNFDLASVPVFDANLTGGTLTYHDASPADLGNLLASTIVQPATTTTYFIKSTTGLGCTDEVAVTVEVLEAPGIDILAADTLRWCRRFEAEINAQPTGTGLAPYSYDWSNGSLGLSTTIEAGVLAGINSYTLRITDANGCTGTDTLWVETLPSISSVNIVIDPVSDCAGEDGVINLDFLDGVSPFDLTWTGPQNGSLNQQTSAVTISDLSQGAYTIVVTDAANCSLTIPNQFVNGPGAIVEGDVIITPASCAGAADGRIDLEVSGTSPSFAWNTGANTEDLSDLSTGWYVLTITDGDCENILDSLFLPEPLPLTFIADVSEPTCVGNNDGQINVMPLGGTPPYSFQWNNGDTQPQISALEAGDYSFDLIDGNGCELNNVLFTINDPTPLSLQIEEQTDPACFGTTTGAIRVNAQGGRSPYQYFWSNGVLGFENSELLAGDYIVTVIDALGCDLVQTISLQEPDILDYTVNLSTPTCNGIADGALSVTPSGGTAPYTISWNTGMADLSLDNLFSGNYAFTLIDFNGCTLESGLIELQAPTVLSLTAATTQPATCQGLADGTIDLTVVGGTLPYQFEWEDGPVTEDRTNLSAGSYTLTITDANGCSEMIGPVPIENADTLSLQVDELTGASCAETSDGLLFVSPQGGEAPYNLNWNLGTDSEDLIELSGGSYYATITDNRGCFATSDTFVITAPEPIEISLQTLETLRCNGEAEGSIDVTVSGGNGDYHYTWTNGRTTEDLSDLEAGVYQVTVVDPLGCFGTSAPFSLTEPEKLQLELMAVEAAGCLNPNSGAASVQVSGGSPAYAYLWSNGSMAPDINGQSSGTYQLTVTDNEGCTDVLAEVVIPQNQDGFPVAVDNLIPVDCAGADNGQITVVPQGGLPPYQYNWSNGTTAVINDNLSGGDYQLTITDANGCVGITPWISVSEPEPLAFFLLGLEDMSCYGQEDGSINLLMTGGTPPYNFAWNHGATTEDISDLSAGDYELTVTDVNNCELVTYVFTIEEPEAPISIASTQIGQVSCFNLADGSIAIEVTGGTPPYSYEWNTGAMSPNINQLTPGIYSCTIQDANQCVQILNATISGPDSALELVNLQISDVTTCGGADGMISLDLTGGTPPYTYQWSNGDSTAEITDLSTGIFQCTVYDANGCFLILSNSTVHAPDNDLSLIPSSTPSEWGQAEGTATVIVSGGLPPFTFLWDAATGEQSDSIAINLSPGSYAVTVTDSQNCSQVQWVDVEGLTDTRNPRQELEIHVFPNPAKDHFILTVTPFQPLNYRLLNTLGQVVTAGTLNNERQEIWMSNLTAGLYFLQLQNHEKPVYLQKILLQP